MSLYVTDTHPLIWYGNRQKKLSRAALRVFERAERGDALFGDWMSALLAHPGYETADLDSEAVIEAVALQTIHDPFDVIGG